MKTFWGKAALEEEGIPPPQSGYLQTRKMTTCKEHSRHSKYLQTSYDSVVTSYYVHKMWD